MKYDSYQPTLQSTSPPKVGDLISHKDPHELNTGVPSRMDLWVLEVRENGIVIAPIFQKERLEPHPSRPPIQNISYLGDGVWRAEDFVLWKRPVEGQ